MMFNFNIMSSVARFFFLASCYHLSCVLALTSTRDERNQLGNDVTTRFLHLQQQHHDEEQHFYSDDFTNTSPISSFPEDDDATRFPEASDDGLSLSSLVLDGRSSSVFSDADTMDSLDRDEIFSEVVDDENQHRPDKVAVIGGGITGIAMVLSLLADDHYRHENGSWIYNAKNRRKRDITLIEQASKKGHSKSASGIIAASMKFNLGEAPFEGSVVEKVKALPTELGYEKLPGFMTKLRVVAGLRKQTDPELQAYYHESEEYLKHLVEIFPKLCWRGAIIHKMCHPILRSHFGAGVELKQTGWGNIFSSIEDTETALSKMEKKVSGNPNKAHPFIVATDSTKRNPKKGSFSGALFRHQQVEGRPELVQETDTQNLLSGAREWFQRKPTEQIGASYDADAGFVRVEVFYKVVEEIFQTFKVREVDNCNARIVLRNEDEHAPFLLKNDEVEQEEQEHLHDQQRHSHSRYAVVCSDTILVRVSKGKR
jgi:hypothetical protein